MILLNDDIEEDPENKIKKRKKDLVYQLKCKPKTRNKESKRKVVRFKRKLVGKSFYSSNQDEVEVDEELSLYNSDQDSDDEMF